MKNRFLLIGAPVLIIGAFVGFLAFNSYHAPGDVTGARFVSPETFRQWISQDKALIVDVQTYDGYLKMHFPGSVTTHAYPVVTGDQKKRVEAIIPTLKKTKKPIVLVCFGGITGAPNARNILVARGIPNKQLYVLQGGSWGFPWKNMMVSGNRP
ncbi:MAG: rhodanese-like domain-containing protein [bacterium]|nr:rhodanese-like domain-containing protein [bacterium]